MKLHPRVMLVQAAQCDFNDAVLGVIQKHDLTYVELMCCLNQIQANWLKHALRDERHHDDDEKRAGEE